MNGVEKIDRQALILEAVLNLLPRDGIAGVSMGAVAREADAPAMPVGAAAGDEAELVGADLRIFAAVVGDADAAVELAEGLRW